MCTRTFSDPANHCDRSPDNPGQSNDIDRRGAPKAAQTSATKKEVRAKAEPWARLSGLLLCRRWRAHVPESCDKKSGVPWWVPFLARAIAIRRASPPRFLLGHFFACGAFLNSLLQA